MKYTWADTIKVVASASSRYRPGSIGSICGMRVIDKEQIAGSFGQPLGTMLYTVEFQDGQSMEIPERLLEKESWYTQT